MTRLALALYANVRSGRIFRLPSSFAMALANLCEIVLPVARGVGLAHLLTPEQFGIALTVTIAASILELITDLGTAQLALKLEEYSYLDTLHSVSLLRAVVLGLVIAALGPIFGAIFHTPGAAWIYSIVGLSSAVRGFVHLDMKRSMRDYNYNGEALSSISSQVAWTVVSFIGALWLRDYRAMAFGSLASTFAYVAVSHLTSKRPWRLGWHRPTASEAIKFGGPLALNGMATALTNLGDRTLTGATISLEQLAQYTALATSAFVPRSAVVKYTNSVFISHFVNANDKENQRRVGYIWLIIVATIAGVFGLGYNMLGQAATTLVFGKAYHPSQTIISSIALLGSVRYMAMLIAPPSLAVGQTSILVRATILSTSGLAIGALFLFASPSLDHLVFGLVIGESIALLWAALRACEMTHLNARIGMIAIWAPLLSLTAITAITHIIPEQSISLRLEIVAVGSFLQFCIIAAVVRMTHVRFVESLRLLFPRRQHSTAF